MPAYSRDFVNYFNGFVMDLCNCLWRNRALNNADKNALGCQIPQYGPPQPLTSSFLFLALWHFFSFLVFLRLLFVPCILVFFLSHLQFTVSFLPVHGVLFYIGVNVQGRSRRPKIRERRTRRCPRDMFLVNSRHGIQSYCRTNIPCDGR